MRWILLIVTELLLFLTNEISAEIAQCRDPCQDCSAGSSCVSTPNGEVACKCPSNMGGDRCDMCRVRPGWFDGGNGYQYAKTALPMNYGMAQKECKRLGGDLAVKGARDPVVWGKILQDVIDNSTVWIGLNDQAIEGTFIWNDGILSSEMTEEWYAGEPNDWQNQDCVVAKSMGWGDMNCENNKFGLCEVPIGCPAKVPLFDARNDCKYTIIPPATRKVSIKLCENMGGKLAVKAVNNDIWIRRVLYWFTESGHISNMNVFTGFTLQSGSYVSESGTSVNTVSGTPWPPYKSGSKDCLTVIPDPFCPYLSDADCDEILPAICEICDEIEYLDERTCKSGKQCPENSICVAHEGSCHEECVCNEGYMGLPDANTTCIPDLCSDGTIGCGDHASCCVINTNTGEQGCLCDRGYVPDVTSTIGACVDPCSTKQCGNNAECLVNIDTAVASCVCIPLYMPNSTAEEGCIPDNCENQNIVCGDNARCCILDDSTNVQGCICEDGYFPNSTAYEGCIDPCSTQSCGNNENCFVDDSVTFPVAACRCNVGYLPIGQPGEGCFLDRCENQDIVCGDNARCCVLDDSTNTQGCICDDGYFPNSTAAEGCIDPCAGIACGSSETCFVDDSSTYPTAACRCDVGYLPNDQPGDGCFLDMCESQDIVCGDNARCCILDDATHAQGCICEDGYFPNATAADGCIDPCTVNSCGSNEQCFVDDSGAFPVAACRCNVGHLPIGNPGDGCFLDECESQDIVCGDNARCCILDDATKTQGCICEDGYYPNSTAAEGCIDPCSTTTCGGNATCFVKFVGSYPRGVCRCNPQYMPVVSACNLCILDRCATRDIICPQNSRCCVLDQSTMEQGCICDTGYFPNPDAQTACDDPCLGTNCASPEVCVVEVDAVTKAATAHCTTLI